MSRSYFRQGLIEGDKLVIYPILVWIFPRVEDLRKRAYLAKYLVRVDIPFEFQQDLELEQVAHQVFKIIDNLFAYRSINAYDSASSS